MRSVTLNKIGMSGPSAYVYDADGHLLKIASRGWDETIDDQIYSYDERGRLLSTVDGKGTQTMFD